MKQKILAVASATGIVLALLGVGLVHAQSFSTNIPQGKTIDGSLYSAAKQVNIHGTINGDVLCAGQDVTIDAAVHGDVICTGADVTIDGEISGNVRVVAATVKLNAVVGHGASLAGSQITVGKSASIAEDFSAAGNKATIDGRIGRDAALASSTTTLVGHIGRNVAMTGTALALQDQAYVGGDLSYTSSNAITTSPESHVVGRTTHATPAPKKRRISALGFLSILLLPMMLVFALVVVLVFPQRIHQLATYPTKKLGRTLLAGIIGAFVLPAVLFVLFLSVVGVTTGFFVTALWLVMVLLSGPVAAYYLGSMLLARSKNAILIMLVGAVVLLLLYLIPVVGLVAAIFAYVLGTGAVLLYVKEHFKAPNYKVE